MNLLRTLLSSLCLAAATVASAQTFPSASSTLAPSKDPTFTGTTKISERLDLSGAISPAQITAATDNYAPTGLATAAVLRVSTDASRNLTGLTGGAAGRVLVVHNVGSADLVLKNESASSTAANRFAMDADLTLTGGKSIVLQYDSTSSRWRAIGGAGASLALPVSVANGGTGGTTQATALAGLGAPFSAVLVKTADFTVTSADRGKLFVCTTNDLAAFFPTASSVGAGFGFYIYAATAGKSVNFEYLDTIYGSMNGFLIVVSDGATWIAISCSQMFNALYSGNYTGITVDADSALLLGPGGEKRVSWSDAGEGLVLFDSGQNSSVNWDDRALLVDDGTTITVDWMNCVLYDQMGEMSYDWSSFKMMGKSAVGGTSGAIDIVMRHSVKTLTPTGDCTLNLGSGIIDGARVTLIITTSGTTSRTISFGTGFKTYGNLVTGTVSGKIFTVSFVCDGSTWIETSRTTAM